MNQEQLEYVKKQLQNGVPAEQVRENLFGAGYTPELVEELFQAAEPGSEVPPATASASLPSVGAFVKESWAVVAQRPDVTWSTVIVVTVLAALLPMIDMLMGPGAGAEALIAVVSLLSAIVSVVLFIAILRVFFSDTSISFGEGLRWAAGHFLSYIWVAILMGLLTLGGFMFFIIPGIILSVYLLLAPVVWLREGVRGMNALVCSTVLIQGNWWRVALRYLVFTLTVGLLMLISGLVLGFVGGILNLMPATTTSESLAISTSWFDVLIAPLTGIVLVASAGALFQIYQGLKGGQSAFVPEQHRSLRTFYIIATALSPFIIILMMALILLPMLLTSLAVFSPMLQSM